MHRTSADTPGPGAGDMAALTCYHCGNKGYTATKCRVDKHVVCHHCGKKGHGLPGKGKTTPKTGHSKSRTVGRVDDEEDEQDSEDSPFHHVSSCGVAHSPPIRIQVKLNECLVNLEVDTGASLSLMSETTFRGLWPGRDLPLVKSASRPTQSNQFLLWVVAV